MLGNLPGGIDVMASIKKAGLLGVASDIVNAFERQDTQMLAYIMIKECVTWADSGIRAQMNNPMFEPDKETLDETEKLFNLLGRPYGKLALQAKIPIVNAIAFNSWLSESTETVSDFPKEKLDEPDFQELLKYAQWLLAKYTWSPNSTQRNLNDILGL